MNTKLKDLNPSEATQRLQQIVVEAYHHLNRYQLPDNLGDMVGRLKNDLLKYMPGVTIETIDEAVTHEILHDEKLAKNPSLFSAVYVFQAVGKHYTKPAETRDMDRDELWQWKERLRWLEEKGLGNSPKADECRWWIDKITKGDTEHDHILFLDTCAEMEKTYRNVEVHPDSEFKTIGQTLAKVLPAFNPRREYHYLVRRGQLALNAEDAFMQQAILDINTERMAERYKRLTKEEAETNCDVKAKAKRLAVIGWLKRCNEQGTTPSVILSPLVNEMEYQRIRKETV